MWWLSRCPLKLPICDKTPLSTERSEQGPVFRNSLPSSRQQKVRGSPPPRHRTAGTRRQCRRFVYYCTLRPVGVTGARIAVLSTAPSAPPDDRGLGWAKTSFTCQLVCIRAVCPRRRAIPPSRMTADGGGRCPGWRHGCRRRDGQCMTAITLNIFMGPSFESHHTARRGGDTLRA
jgi:hypothetical protein